MKPVLGIVLIVVATVALIAAGLVLVGVRAGRRQRLVLQQARRDGAAAYLCLPANGQLRGAMATVTVDSHEIRVVLQKAQPVTITSLPVAGSTVEPARVRINTAAVVDGLRVTAADGRDVRLALYPDPTLRHTKPLQGPQLLEAITAISQAIDQGSR